MLFELNIIPMGAGEHVSAEIAEAVRMVKQSGLPYRLMPSATCIEGEWAEVMALIKRCHDRVREMCPHLVTTIKIEDDRDARDKLMSNVASVEEKLDQRERSAEGLLKEVP